MSRLDRLICRSPTVAATIAGVLVAGLVAAALYPLVGANALMLFGFVPGASVPICALFVATMRCRRSGHATPDYVITRMAFLAVTLPFVQLVISTAASYGALALAWSGALDSGAPRLVFLLVVGVIVALELLVVMGPVRIVFGRTVWHPSAPRR